MEKEFQSAALFLVVYGFQEDINGKVNYKWWQEIRGLSKD
ncbi:MAG: hypothetical protein H6Q70_3026 [Firmicutes bacterium]|nr:hypothetical protein [Bacillota bacterium]